MRYKKYIALGWDDGFDKWEKQGGRDINDTKR
jgi:hypothetical protein